MKTKTKINSKGKKLPTIILPGGKIHKADPYNLPDSVAELDDMVAELWYDYFEPKTPFPSRAEKTKVMEHYNAAAQKSNELRHFKAHIILTPSTSWVPRREEETWKMHNRRFGPSWGEDKRPREEDQNVAIAKPDRQIISYPEAKAKNGQSRASTFENSDAPVIASKGLGIVQQIIELHKQGLSTKEIIAKGFNKNTVNRQVSDYKRSLKK